MSDRARRSPHPQPTNSVAEPRRRAPEHQVLKLQRQVGNRAVATFVNALAVQRAKEGDGPSNDIGIIQQQLNAVGASPRLAITGRVDTATTAANKAFQKKLIDQKMPGVTEDGIVAGITQAQLTLRAPPVKISDTETVVVGPGNTQVPTDPTLGTHKQLQAGSKGVAVKELQEGPNKN